MLRDVGAARRRLLRDVGRCAARRGPLRDTQNRTEFILHHSIVISHTSSVIRHSQSDLHLALRIDCASAMWLYLFVRSPLLHGCRLKYLAGIRLLQNCRTP